MRRAQNAGLAAALIITIGLITLLYVLFLPPADRAALLNGEVLPEPGSGTISPLQTILLDEQPGRLNALREPSLRHRLNDAYLTATREDTILLERESIVLTRSVGDEQYASLPVQARVGRVANAMLILQDVEAVQGRPILLVYLNGVKVWERRIGGSVHSLTIRLPADVLEADESHTLTLRISSPPWYAPWRTHEVRIGKLEVLGQVVDEQSASSMQSVSLAEDEARQLRAAYLTFTPVCDEPPRLLTVSVNGNTLLSTQPRCASPLRVDIPPSLLQAGENTVWLRVYDGTLRVDSPFLVTILDEPVHPVYYFRVEGLDWEDVQQGRARVLLKIEIPRFSPASVDVSVNNHPRVNIRETTEVDITRDIREGENYIQLIPRRESEISRLIVVLTRSA